MNIGMLWLDASNEPLEVKIKKAVDYYQNKYGKAATVVFANPSDVKINIAVNGIAVRPNPAVLPKHFWVGTEIKP